MLYVVYMATPRSASIDKQLDELDFHCRTFIEKFAIYGLGTVGDVSPKGDHPGFIKGTKWKDFGYTRPQGNNRLDSLKNVIVDSRVALIFYTRD